MDGSARQRRTTAAGPGADLADDPPAVVTEAAGVVRGHGGKEATARLRIERERFHGNGHVTSDDHRRGRSRTVPGVPAGAHAASRGISGADVERERGGVEVEPNTATLGHLPCVPDQAVPGHVRARMGAAAVMCPGQVLGGRTVGPPHPIDRSRLGIVVRPGERDAGTERFGQDEHVPRAGAALRPHPVRMDDTLHREPEDDLVAADRVPARGDTTGVDDGLGGGGEDRFDHRRREALGKGGDVHRQADLAAHREDIGARVGGGDGAEVAGIVDERRKEVSRAHECDVGRQAQDRGVIERGEADQQRLLRTVGREVGDEIAEEARSPLRRTPAARGPLGEPNRVDRALTEVHGGTL